MKLSLYPLYQFKSDASSPFAIADGVTLARNQISSNISKILGLSKKEIHSLTYPEFCLEVDESIIAPEKASIAFIVSCRLLKRCKVFIRYRVNSQYELIEVRDNYPHDTSKITTTIIRKSELNRLADIYAGLNIFKDINIRTNNAVYFLRLAYTSRGALESLIFHVCALETLASATRKEGNSTDKFEKRINHFIGVESGKLRKIYNARSGLVHGRFRCESVMKRLTLNRIAETICKKTFVKILLDENIINAFRNNRKRMKLFGE